MLATALIVFREVLEAAFIVTIMMAATLGVPHRGKWISLGVAGGTVGAATIAVLMQAISALFDGAGQELVDAAILFIAVALISWHIVWMNAHGRKLAADMRAVGNSVAAGEKHLSVLAIVVALAVMREGSEIVLMLQGLWATDSKFLMTIGAGLGLAAGVAVGALMYAGFLVLSMQRVFAVTNVMLSLIAAGMMARAANLLAQAGLFPALGSRIWDTSNILSDQSMVGQLLSALIGYIARPSGIEILFYGLTVIVLAILTTMANRKMLNRIPAIAVFVAVLLLGSILPFAVKADEVLSPYVTKGEFELEQQGYISRDQNPANNGAQNLVYSMGYSPTAWWRAEFEGEYERDAGPGNQIHYESFNWENTFQLAQPGEYWLDPGAFFEVDFARENEPNNFIFGFLGAKNIGWVTDTFNLLLHKDVGSGNTPIGFIYSNQTKYRWKAWLEPGFELYGDTDGMTKFSDQQLGIGPGIFGKIYGDQGQAIKYELAYLFGATPASPDGAVRWKVEYEIAF